MEDLAPDFNREQELKPDIEVDKNKLLGTKFLNTIEVPNLILRDHLRILKSTHVKID